MKKKIRWNYWLLLLITFYAAGTASSFLASKISGIDWYEMNIPVKAIQDGHYLLQMQGQIVYDYQTFAFGFLILLFVVHAWINHNENGRSGREFLASLPISRKEEITTSMLLHVIYIVFGCVVFGICMEIMELVPWKRFQILMPQFSIAFSGVTYWREMVAAFSLLLVFAVIVLLCETVTNNKNVGLFLSISIAMGIYGLILTPLYYIIAGNRIFGDVIINLIAAALLFVLTVFLYKRAEYSGGGTFRFHFARNLFMAGLLGTWLFTAYSDFWLEGLKSYFIPVVFAGIAIDGGVYYLTTAKGLRNKPKEIGSSILWTCGMSAIIIALLCTATNLEKPYPEAVPYPEGMTDEMKNSLSEQAEKQKAENEDTLELVTQELFGKITGDEIFYEECYDFYFHDSDAIETAWQSGYVYINPDSEEWNAKGYYMVLTPLSSGITQINIPICEEDNADQYKAVIINYRGTPEELKKRMNV